MNPWQRRGAIALVAFHVMVPIGLFVQHWPADESYAIHSDAGRYQRIAVASRDPFENSEYPPAAVVLFKGIGPKPFRDFFLRLLVVQALAQAITVMCMFWAWGRRAGWRYLVLSAPLLPIVLTRYDLVAVAAAVAGAACVTRGRPRAGGALLALGAFVKVWPAALLPGLAARRQWRALVAGGVVFAVALGAWIADTGTKGVRQVLTYRGARGWHIESVPGSLVYLFRRKTPSFRGGAWRVGAPPGFWTALLLLGLVVTIAWVWWRVARSGINLVGLADLTVVSALLAWSTLCSPQFIAWIVPWAAIAGARGHGRAERVAAAVVLLTVAAAAATTGDARPTLLSEVLYLGRNGALVALTVVGIRTISRSRTAQFAT